MLVMVGHAVDTVCPDKKAGETVRTAVHDFELRCPDLTLSDIKGKSIAGARFYSDVFVIDGAAGIVALEGDSAA